MHAPGIIDADGHVVEPDSVFEERLAVFARRLPAAVS